MLGRPPASPDNDAIRSALIETELQTLYEVSRMLSRTLDVRESIGNVLRLLHEAGIAKNGMLSLRDRETGKLVISAFHDPADRHHPPVSYGPGEGILGLILEKGQTIIVPRIAEEPRFLGRLGIYDANLPFIGVPLIIGEEALGVFAAQPPDDRARLNDRARFLEMVANLIAQTVRLNAEVEKRHRELRDERDVLRRAVKNQHGFDQIVGRTKAMRKVFEQVRLVAKWNTTVLVCGESGSGKELIAHAIHYNSPRHGGPLIALNCAALPDNLLESELFGHEKGAFTGAVALRKGRFEQAHGGTLFLDEIGEISPAFQAKLLRVLQHGQFERVGGMKTLSVDVRIIAATNRVLETQVANGRFREDLYYRLNVMPIQLPALRERSEDIPELARCLVERIAQKQGRRLSITDGAVGLLLNHSWPGNVRELENHLERCAILCEGDVIERGDIGFAGSAPPALVRELPAATEPPRPGLDDPDLEERERVIAALREAGWVQAKAARLLGMTPRQIAYRIKILNIVMRQF